MLYVPESYICSGYNSGNYEPADPNTSMPRGTPVVLSSGKVQAATLSGGKVAATNTLFGVTNEPYNASLSGAGSVPIQQKKVNVTVFLPGVPVVAGWHVDNNPSNNANKLSTSMIGSDVAVKYDSTKGEYLATTWATGDAAFTVVGLVDPAGTLWGKLVLVPKENVRLFA